MRYAVAVFVVLAAPSLAYSAEPKRDIIKEIKADCEKEWQSDYSMQEYCIDKQRTALSEVAAILKTTLDDKEKVILSTCLSEWSTTNGNDWSMVKYCYDKQHAAYKRLGG